MNWNQSNNNLFLLHISFRCIKHGSGLRHVQWSTNQTFHCKYSLKWRYGVVKKTTEPILKKDFVSTFLTSLYYKNLINLVAIFKDLWLLCSHIVVTNQRIWLNSAFGWIVRKIWHFKDLWYKMGFQFWYPFIYGTPSIISNP